MALPLLIRTVLRATLVVLVATVPFSAMAATFSLGGPPAPVVAGETFEVPVTFDASGENVNALSGTLSFSSSTLELVGVRDAGSILPLWITPPQGTPDGVPFAGVVPGGYRGAHGFLFALEFKALAAGAARVTLLAPKALLNDGKGTPVLVSAPPLTFSVRAGSGIATMPRVHDTTPPEPFTPTVTRDPALFGGAWFVSFSTTDKGTGIAGYEVKEVKDPLLALFTPWTPATSPYRLSDQTRASYVYVRALDNAGNARVERVNPLHPLPWFRTWGIIGLVLIVLGVLGYWLWKRTHTH